MEINTIKPQKILKEIDRLNHEIDCLRWQTVLCIQLNKPSQSRSPIADKWEKLGLPIDDILDWENYEKELTKEYCKD